MVGDPVEAVGREGVVVERTVAVLHGRDLVLEAELELTHRIEQCRREAPHPVHGRRTGIEELRIGTKK